MESNLKIANFHILVRLRLLPTIEFIQQMGEGPAKGLFQMEKATYDDIWENFLKYKPALSNKVDDLSIITIASSNIDGFNQLCGNNYYAAAMCRVHYLRVKESMPKEDDLQGMANYWKKYYNTHLGKGKPEDFINKAKSIMELR
jgi:hypothetical protein